MQKHFFSAGIIALVVLLSASQAQAQAPAFTSFAQLNDSLVAQFNRGAFETVEGYSSPALRKLESTGSLSRSFERVAS